MGSIPTTTDTAETKTLSATGCLQQIDCCVVLVASYQAGVVAVYNAYPKVSIHTHIYIYHIYIAVYV